MRHVFVLGFILIQLTAPNGGPVFVARESVVVIAMAKECGTGTRIITTNNSFCVQESLKDATKRIRDGVEFHG